MSYKNVDMKEIEGVRKVRWDELWHVLYQYGKRHTFDRVDRKEAMSVLKKIEKSRTKELIMVRKLREKCNQD